MDCSSKSVATDVHTFQNDTEIEDSIFQTRLEDLSNDSCTRIV